MKCSRSKEAKKRNWSRIFDKFGRKCMVCGVESEHPIYEFHHHNKEGKEANISRILHHSWEKVSREVEKCILVCANCHRIIHDIERKRKR